MIRLPNDFKEFIQFLNARAVEYVIVGGYALAIHGYVRYTGDIDFFIALNPDNAEKMVNVFRDFGLNTPELNSALFLDEGKILRVGSEPMRLEVLNKISGVDFAECYQNRQELCIDGVSVNFVGYRELVKNKRATGREKDRADVIELERRHAVKVDAPEAN